VSRPGAPSTLLAAGTLVTGHDVHQPGWLRWSGGHLLEVGAGAPPSEVQVNLPTSVVVPGFVDQHCHGGGGTSLAGTAEDALAAVALHRRHGTTTVVASLVSAGTGALLRSIGILADLVDDGELAGVHLEGPWLAPGRAGAHDPAELRDPTREEVDRLLRAGGGVVRMVTIAPERPGALEAVERITGAGGVVAVGHTGADYDLTRAALAAGARVATHLFNAMAPLHHRHPGPVPALVEDPRVVLELVADGVHLHPALVRHTVAAAGPGRVALVTDAMAAAGAGDGTYRLGGLDVTVAGGLAHLSGTTTIAGSTTTMDAAFRAAVAASPGSRSQALVAAAAMTSATPARALGLDDIGVLESGRRADAVVLDEGLDVTAVGRRGRGVPGPGGSGAGAPGSLDVPAGPTGRLG
jgi:N-acetylglucosamine-6-phosphate deacetylase